jgi:hypothetical protein
MRISGSHVLAVATGLVAFDAVNGGVVVEAAGAKSSRAPGYSLATVGAFGGRAEHHG